MTIASSHEGVPRRVLLIEDDTDDAQLIAENLADAFGDLECIRRTGIEGASDLRGQAIDVVLLDLVLPDGQGQGSVPVLREWFGDAPVIVVTHTDDSSSERGCLSAGAQDYIMKSDLGPRALRRAILHALERHQLHQARESARALERELAGVVQHAHEAIVVWDGSGRIVTWNPAAETLYGRDAAEAIGGLVDALVPEAGLSEFRDQQRRLLAGERLDASETLRLHRDGHVVEVEESLFAIRTSGSRTRFASVARDLTRVARLRRATEFLSERRVRAGEIEGSRSPAMQEALRAADLVARDPSATVLLLGETGTGKGYLARHVHEKSARRGRAFLEINCAGLAPQLLESELFGHERGSFTGAVSQKRGLVEAAEGGTLFLDEVGELPIPVQAQLLTFLDSRSFRRVGGTHTLASDIRLLAATNADLRRSVELGKFRLDLFYRLSIVPIRVPPLRHRLEDIPLLIDEILAGLTGTRGTRRVAIHHRAVALMQRYRWPGNVRELRNTLERALILGSGDTILPEHLPLEIAGDRPPESQSGVTLEDAERAHILRVLDETQGNRTRAAERLGVSRSTLKRKLAEMRRKTAQNRALEA